MIRLTLLLPLALAACTTLPDLEGSLSPEAQAADYPELLPIKPILNTAPAPTADTTAARAPLQARADRLRARAARLRALTL